MEIDYNVKFLLRDLGTNEELCFLLQYYTTATEPIFIQNIQRDNLGSDTKITSKGSYIMPDGTTIITNVSPLGKEVYKKKSNDTITYNILGKQYKWLVLAVGQDEIDSYNTVKLEALKSEKKEERIIATNKNTAVFLTLDPVKHINENPSKHNNKSIELYKNALKEKSLAVVRLPYWTEDYCFVIENLSVFEDIIYLIGKTYQRGEIYYQKIRYDSRKNFVSYNGTYKTKILSYYKNKNTLKEDPIENNPYYIPILNTVDALVKDKIGFAWGMGYCHVYWSWKKKYLKELFDIDWKSPAELNPDVIFD